jgi:LysR family transcriptional regulator, benzoate and cis,cis-muconate-responsive activator of ben and cat genes
MSQPPLSRQIQALEELIGVKLFDRNTHGVSLTAAGEALLKDAYSVLTTLDAAVGSMERFAQREARGASPVRLGLTSAIDFTLMPKLHAVLRRHPPLVSGKPERTYSRHLVERVRTGRLDLAIVGDIVAPGDDLKIYRVGYDPMMVALPSAHPAAQLSHVTFRDLGDTPLFWFPRSDNPALYDKCEQVFSAFQYRASRRLEPADFTSLLAMIAAGDGLAICPASMCAASRVGVTYRPFEPALERNLTIDVQLIMRTAETRDDVLNKVQEILSAAAA